MPTDSDYRNLGPPRTHHFDSPHAGAQAQITLFGPFVVDYTDIPHNLDKKVLWTPQAGDVLLRLFPDYNTVVQWDVGSLCIGQDVSWEHDFNFLAMAAAGSVGHTIFADDPVLDFLYDTILRDGTDATGNEVVSTGRIFTTTAPVQIQLGNTPGVDPARGHVELYALIARAVAP